MFDTALGTFDIGVGPLTVGAGAGVCWDGAEAAAFDNWNENHKLSVSIRPRKKICKKGREKGSSFDNWKGNHSRSSKNTKILQQGHRPKLVNHTNKHYPNLLRPKTKHDYRGNS